MTISNSSGIITNGLVFAFDMSNTKKSWKGNPVTNLYGDFATSSSLRTNTLHFTNGNGWLTTGYTALGVPDPGVYLGKVYKFVSGALNSTWSGNSYGYMFKDIASTNGVAYTMSYWAYVSKDCNIDYLPASVETTSGYAAANLPSNYDLTKKGTWQRIGLSSTGIGTTTRWLTYPQKYGVTDGSFTGFFLISGMQVEEGTFASPFSESSRSTTQAVFDMVGGNTLTANSLTYASDGSFSFNGSNNKITLSSNNIISGTSDYTLDATIRLTDTSGVDYIFGNYGSANSGGIEWYTFQNKLNNYIGGNTQSNTSLVANQWYHVCTTRSAGLVTHYLNGVADGSATNANSIATTNPYTIGNGHDYTSEAFSGKIDTVKVYNGALSAAEVKQNFNAIRGRYGL